MKGNLQRSMAVKVFCLLCVYVVLWFTKCLVESSDGK